MFMAVGPPAFTSLAIIGMADSFPQDTTYFGENGPATANTVRLLATLVAIFIWSLAFWFFCIALVAILAVAKELTFHLNWWTFFFPNVGLTLSMLKIGSVFNSTGVRWLGSALSICLVGTYLFVFTMCVRAVVTGQILSEGKDEDAYVVEERPLKERKREANRSKAQEKSE
jgi:tellurite resistance protein TehA-like permease